MNTQSFRQLLKDDQFIYMPSAYDALGGRLVEQSNILRASFNRLAHNSSVANELSRRMAANPQSLRIHQHGYTHTNHELTGKKCEFGMARDYLLQRSDIENGRRRLTDLLVRSIQFLRHHGTAVRM